VLRQEVVSLRFVRPGHCCVECSPGYQGSLHRSAPGTHTMPKDVFALGRQVKVKDRDGWKIAVYHNVDVKPGRYGARAPIGLPRSQTSTLGRLVRYYGPAVTCVISSGLSAIVMLNSDPPLEQA